MPRTLALGEPLAFALQPGTRAWALLGQGELPEGDCYLASVSPDQAVSIEAYIEGSTGNVFACGSTDEMPPPIADALPLVRIVGELSGETGQVTVLQPDGSYRRFSRWDRVSGSVPAHPNAMVRTLPQCGCGGSLGMPMVFNSFAEMSAYFFCTFSYYATAERSSRGKARLPETRSADRDPNQTKPAIRR